MIPYLEKLGLTNTEAKVYLALLEEGQTTVGKIAEKSNVYRKNVYECLDRLINKGLVSFIRIGKIKYFRAFPPEKLLDYVKDKEEIVIRILPELKQKTKKEEECVTAEIFKGKEGIKFILNDLIRERKNVIALGEEGKIQNIIPFDSKKYIKQIEEIKLKERIITREKFREKIVKSKYTKIRYLSDKHISPSSVIVYGNKVINFIWSLPYYTIVIKNKDLANSYRVYFEFLWNTAKK